MKALVTLILMILVFMPATILAEYTITGEVTDEAGQPLPGATILVSETGQGTTTDLEGAFRLSLNQGEWTLVINYIGQQSRQLLVSIPGQSGEHFEVRLPDDIVAIDEILVTGSVFERITRYQPTQTYNALELQQRNTTSMGTLLDGESGVAMRSMGNAPARPVVRGMDGERIQVLQNGMNMGDISSTAHDHGVTMDPMAVDRVDIVRGPAGLIYGSSALGGLINIHTDDIPSNWSAGYSGHLSGEGQTGMNALAGGGRVTYGSGNLGVTLRGNLRNTGNMKTPAGEIPDTDLQSVHLGSGFAWKTAHSHSGASIQYSDQQYGIPEDPSDPDEQIELTMQRLAIQGVHHRRFNHDFWEAAEARITYNDYRHDEMEYEYVDGELVDEDLELSVDQRYFQANILFQHGSGGWLESGTAGLNVDYREMAVGGDESLSPDARGFTVAGFLVEEFRLPRNWSVQSGFRLEWNRTEALPNEDFPDAGEIRNQGIWAGAAGISGPVFANLESGIQVSRAHRTPSIEELFADAIHLAAGRYEIGDPDLANEIGYGVDWFANYRSDRRDIHLALFINSISDYISLRPTGETDPDRGLPVMEYFGTDALLFGGEFSVEQRILESFTVTAKADYIRGSERTDGNSEPLPYMPPMRFTGGVSYDTGFWWAGVSVRHVLSQERTAQEELATDGYTLTNINAGMRLGRQQIHTVTLGVDNLFDVTWRDHLSRIEQRDIPMMGRNIRISYRYTF